MIQKILIISNCATEAYHKMFSLFLPNVEVSSMHVSNLIANHTESRGDLQNMDSYDYIFIIPPHKDKLPGGISQKTKIVEIPGFYFSGYHPDTCSAVERNRPARQVSTRFGAYHSITAIGAFLSGLSPQDTLRLYCGDVYERLGYFEDWGASKSNLMNVYRAASLPIDELFTNWSRRGCFMHTFNHPHVQCFADIARKICELHFPDFLDTPYVIADRLAGYAIYPCYPEIGERRGSKGSYIFKIGGDDRAIELEEYVNMCFSSYEEYEKDSITVAPPYKKKLANIQEYIASEFGK